VHKITTIEKDQIAGMKRPRERRRNYCMFHTRPGCKRPRRMTMKRKRLLLLVLLLVSQGVGATEHTHFFTGSTILKFCKAYVDSKNVQDIADGNVCVGYVAGINDMKKTLLYWDDITKRWCEPASVTASKLVRVYLKYLEEHPEKLLFPASDLLTFAFHDAFPCN
jgi:hypothetical protein